jgi:hypothetical protein
MPLVYVWAEFTGLLLPLVPVLELANIKPGGLVLLRAEPNE